MTSNYLSALLIAASLTQFATGQGFGEAKALADWRFHLGDVKYGERVTLDESEWERVRVPHDWTVKQVPSPHLASATGYLPGGIAWYRTNLHIPKNAADKRHYLYFEGVYNNSEVFINGNWLGKRPNGYVSFMYDISNYVQPGDDNVVAVRVDHSEDADSRWYTGSGIYRDVFLVSANQIHLDQWGVAYGTTLNDDGSAEIELTAKVRNHLPQEAEPTVRFELLDEQGTVVAQSEASLEVDAAAAATSVQSVRIQNPELWDLDHPYLYQLATTVSRDGETRDRSVTNIGIRKVDFDPNKGLALNGKWIKVKGVCLHHDAGTLGAAVPKEVWRARVSRLKEIGVNGIRMSHNPHAPDLYEVCDELGMLVMDEAFDEWEYPKKKWIEGWNVGTPGFQGPADYFREWGKRDLKSLVLRDRNHPSIIMWSIGNEVDYPNDPYSHPILEQEGIGQIHTAGYQTSQPHADRLGGIAKELAAILRANDPSRPVTAALAGVVMSNETEYPGALDVVGYNYTENRYEMDHRDYPQRVIYGSENRHDLGAWKAVRDNDFIFGQFLWTGFDYLGEAGRWPSRGFETGLINQANDIKPRGYFRKALWTESPMIYLGSYPVPSRERGPSIDAPKLWNWDPGQNMRVVAYTNCDAAELYLNGKLVGKKTPYNDETGIIQWDIPFKPGTLSAVAYRDGKKVAEDEIVTAAAPRSIVARTDSARLESEGAVALVTLEARDADGRISRRADNLVTCNITGPGRLLGLENASSNVTEDFTTNRLRFIDGKLLAYIQATGEKGTIEVQFSSPYLESALITIPSGE